MTIAFSIPLAITLMLFAALGYAVATIGIKSAADHHMELGLALALLGFALAFIAEMTLMRQINLSVVYVGIIAAETIAVLSYAAWIGEGLSLRQGVGAAMVLAGLATVSL